LPSGVERGSAVVLAAVLSGFVFDFCARFKIGGLNLNLFIVKQLPVLPPSALAVVNPWGDRDETVLDWLIPRVLEMTYTARDLEPFAEDCGRSGPPFRWDENRRFLILCELDAAFFHVYLGTEEEWARQPASLTTLFPTPRDAVSYIMDSFPIVRRRDVEQFDGDYRTKRVILEIYDAMSDSLKSGQPYQTKLDPPPADPRTAH